MKLTCSKCKYSWTSKKEDPRECPACKSRYWKVKKKTDGGGVVA